MRLFVAVWPPPEVVDALAGLERPQVDGLRWTTAEQWHVTLRFLGHVDEVAATEAFGSISGKGATAEMGPATGHFGRRVVHAPVAGLEDLAAATVAATGGVGEPPDSRPFAGHITLARARHRRGLDLRALAGAPLTGRWAVDEVTLVASLPGGRGPVRYQVLETLPLTWPSASVGDTC
ncbi:MAG: RNA 2',3'-cyclic phosphodiesterase [Actinomycetota bacterium]|nr:RNA 2',3'-cyclic phosphodiesterase [Actinomycetota bacterium]